jgi:predicted alpha-1,2-mannosidase
MKPNKLILSILCIGLCMAGYAQKYTDFVDPYIGSGGHGHVFVGANVPFGAVQTGPSNFFKGWDWCSGYNYRDSVIIGFPQLHLSGTGIGDLGDVLLMPYMGDVKLQKGKETERYSGYASQFSHKNETVRPGYYSVTLDDYQIHVELTASERVAFHRYSFPQGRQARIIIDLQEGINDKSVDTYLQQVDKYTIHGYRSSEGWAKRQQVFFAIRSSVPLTGFSLYDGETPLAGKTAQGAAIKGLITFEQSPGEVMLKVGISPVSAANAQANIRSEIPGWDFDGIVRRADEKWNRELSKIDIATSVETDRRIFYTAMYHAMMHPSLFDDANGDRMGADWTVHRNAGFDNYTIFSLWDTYRAAHPLLTIIDTRRTADFVDAMLAVFDETGALPIWHLRGYDTGTMVGINSFQVIAEAYLKGIEGFDAEKAFRAMKATAMSDMRGLDYDRDLKPIPSDVMTNRPVATALEYAIGTASIALMAKKMGKTEDYAYFSRRAENYRLYFDRDAGFFRGKMAGGAWNPVFDPIKSKRPWATDYAEGNAWQYLWLVPQDVEGLIELTGGEQAFEDRLNTFFSLTADDDEDVLVDLTGCIGQYAHGNEPSHHIAYLYASIGQQWKTARLTRRIIRDFYSDRPDGIIGNEDCGQMSAWYIFSSLGFYPVFTASGQYVLGSPLFDRATIRLESGKTFTVEAIHQSPENIYIQSVELNGKAYPFSYIRHDDLMRGGTLKIRMGSKPNYTFGQDPSTRPQTRSESVRLSKPFVRPGMAQSREDLDYMKQQVADGKEPWRTAFTSLKKQTSPDFRPDAVSFVSEGPYGENSIGGREFHRSSTEVYANAVLWYITGGRQYAGKAIEILNAWSSKLRSFDANNAKLNVGLHAYYFLNAAEILEHSDAGWNEKDRKQFREMVLTVFYPTIEDFFTEANGNWDASMISTMLCIGVYTERLDIFNRAVERFYWGVGNSGITKYIYPGGQCQEATRDWDHVQLGIGELAKAAQTALTQGLDFYGVAQDRLAYAYEQCSQIMLGDGEPDIFGLLSKRDREEYKDIYESFYDYYANVRGIALPHTREVILNHTRARFPLGTLTGLRRFPVPAPGEQLSALPAIDHLKASATGALEQNTRAFRADDIIVRPGENIQEAIDRNKGKTIVLEKGVHTLHAPLKISGGLTLAGCGRETVLFLSPELRTETVTTDGDELTNVTIRDLLIEGAVSVTENSDPNHDRRTRSYMSAPSREGIVIRSERGAKISHLTFENITVRNFTKNGLLIVGASNVKIYRCDFSDNGSSVVPGAGFHHNLHLSHVTDVEITGSRFDASPFGNGVALLSSRNVRMTGNEMCRNKRSGIYCADSENVTILDNLAEGNDLDGISLDAMATNCASVTVRGNLLQHNGRHGMRTVRVVRLTEGDNIDLFNRCRPAIDVLPAPDPLYPDYVRYPQEEWEKPFAGFGFGVYRKDGSTLPYRFYAPENVRETEKLPLVLLMHGAGERGIDNRYLFFRMKGLPFWETYRCYVLAPQCPARIDVDTDADCVWVDTPFGASAHEMKTLPTRPMQLAIALLDSIVSLPQIDASRIYITGLSMGGFITGAGGSPRYTEYPGVGHGAWTNAYADPKLWEWMFEQKR